MMKTLMKYFAVFSINNLAEKCSGIYSMRTKHEMGITLRAQQSKAAIKLKTQLSDGYVKQRGPLQGSIAFQSTMH